MNNAIETSLRMMDEQEEFLPENHTSYAIRHGGFAVWEPDVVMIAVPYDPVDGDDAHTMFILFCAGDPGMMARFAFDWARRGFTHLVWAREFKNYGPRGYQKHPLKHAGALTSALNRHGKRLA